MEPTGFVALIAVIAFVVVCAVFFLSAGNAGDVSQAWKTIAEKFDLELIDGGWGGEMNMSGRVDGHEISARTLTVSVGVDDPKHRRTIVRARVAQTGFDGLNIRDESMSEKLLKAMGQEDIEIGDAELDKAFVIEGSEPKRVRELLAQPGIKETLLARKEYGGQVYFDDGWVKVSMKGRCGRADALESAIGCVTAMVEAANRAEPSVAAKDKDDQSW